MGSGGLPDPLRAKLAIGRAEEEAPVNGRRTTREPVDANVGFVDRARGLPDDGGR